MDVSSRLVDYVYAFMKRRFVDSGSNSEARKVSTEVPLSLIGQISFLSIRQGIDAASGGQTTVVDSAKGRPARLSRN